MLNLDSSSAWWSVRVLVGALREGRGRMGSFGSVVINIYLPDTK